MTQLSKRGRNIRTNNSLRSYEREDQSVAIFMDRSFTTDKSEKEYSYCLKFSNHAITRSDQRAIDLDTISIILDYGITFQKQGLEFCTCLQREIPRSVDPQNDSHSTKPSIELGFVRYDSLAVNRCQTSSFNSVNPV